MNNIFVEFLKSNALFQLNPVLHYEKNGPKFEMTGNSDRIWKARSNNLKGTIKG